MSIEEIAMRPAASSASADTSSLTSRDAAPRNGRAVAVGDRLHWPQNHELAESSIPNLLTVVAQNALIVIPAERCVVFMYDKPTNMLTAQVSYEGNAFRNVTDAETRILQTIDSEEEEELSFPPVMGVVSACFLQRRCLRMQEPSLHTSFHREYDVPKEMVMNSIIVAPVTLHHRTVGVIELVNRIDPEVPAALPDAPPETAPSKDSEIVDDDENEITLTRTDAVQQRARIGFSAKDEQKMIQFTSHVAQLLDNKLKLLAQLESTAKLREAQAKTAMELLEMMNNTLEYRPPQLHEKTPVRITKRRSSMATRADTAAWPQPPKQRTMEGERVVQGLNDIDMMKAMVGICRTQAVFRGHHLRKVHQLAEALQQHRNGRRQVKSALVIQRAMRRFLGRCWRRHRRDAVCVIRRAIKSYQVRAALAQRVERKKEKRAVVAVDKPREGAHHAHVESEVHRMQKRCSSAIKIQQQFRGHTVRKQIEKIVGFKDFTKGLKNIVKLQSVLRGNIARKHVAKLREEKRAARAVKVICMRLAASDNDVGNGVAASQLPARHVWNSRDCLYPLPALPNGASVVANRIAATCIISTVGPEDQLRTRKAYANAPSPATGFRGRRRLIHVGAKTTVTNQRESQDCSWISPVSRPLAPSPLASPRMPMERSTPNPLDSVQVNRIHLARLHPEVVFELDPKRAKHCPPGVQRADDWLPHRPRHPLSTRRQSILDERDVEDAVSPTSRNPSSETGRKQTSPNLGLPRLVDSPVRSNQLQVCFLSTENTPRPTTRQPHEDNSPSHSPPTQPKTSRALFAPASPRRPLTTR